jgi:hypothetical protein
MGIILRIAGLALLCISLSAAVDARGFMRFGGKAWSTITSVSFGSPIWYNGTQPSGLYMDGDTYASTWADDDVPYMMTNDTHGQQHAGASSNIQINRISTFDISTAITLVNGMAQWGAFNTNTGSPPASFKSGGLISIGGVLYLQTWRLDQANGSVGYDGQLIKSTDHGANWTPLPPPTALPYVSPMFPGYDHPIGWVQYGKNYTGNGPDNSGTYAYALIRNAAPSSTGANPRLARVAIANIANQVATDWSYYQGGDGMSNANWGALSTAASILPPCCLVVSIQYLPRYRQYVTFVTRFVASPGSVWDLYTAPHPWGPWELIATSPYYVPQQLVFPFIAPKSLVNGGQSFTVVANGNFITDCGPTLPSGYYCPYLVPITLGP